MLHSLEHQHGGPEVALWEITPRSSGRVLYRQEVSPIPTLADLWSSYQLLKFVRYLLFGFPVIGLGGNFPVDKEDFRPSPATLKWQHPYPIRQEGFAIWHASKSWQNFLLYAGSLVLCHFSANDRRKGWCRAPSRSVNSSAMLALIHALWYVHVGKSASSSFGSFCIS